MILGFTIGEWIAYHARNKPQKIAVMDHHSGRRLTYAEFNARAARLATALSKKYGIGKGDRIAVLAHNTTDSFEIAAALSRLGAIYCGLNWRLTLPELHYIVNDLSPKLLFSGPEFQETAVVLSEQLGPKFIIWPGDGSPSDYEKLIADYEPWPGGSFAAGEEDIYIIMYTSGTTGRPKGAIITHKMNFWNAVHCIVVCELSHDTVNLSPLPQFHIAGINTFAGPTFYIGGTVYVMRKVEADEIMKVLKDDSVGISHCCGVPTLYEIIAAHPDFPDMEFKRLKSVGAGGASISPALIRKWWDKGVAMQQGFGMTESSPTMMVLSTSQALEKIGSSGKPLMHAEAKLVDAEGEDITEPNIVGEICLRGPNVTPGYWNNEKATRESYLEGGWFRTGDAGRRDEEGYYYVVDRWKDMYKSGGENVYPAEVEKLIYELPQVKEVTVIGLPDERWGEVGRAYIVLHEGTALSEAEVIEFCQGKLARFKQPRSVRFLKELPHNATGKVLKRDLRNEAVAEMEKERKAS
jgi:fatty-acyl-CoA synthase